MSATLTWKMSPLQTKSGTAIGDLFADLLAMFTANASDPDYSWQVASSNVASTPYQITLKPKSGGAGRILIVAYTSTPAGVNPALFDSAPSVSGTRVWMAFFPSGNVDTPSNLSAASGAVMGNDTGCTRAAYCGLLASVYTTSLQCYYADSAEGIYLFFQNPAQANTYGGGAGYLVVDTADDTERAAAIGMGAGGAAGTSWGSMSGSSSSISFTAGGVSIGGSGGAALRVYRAGASRDAFQAFGPTGWASQAIGANDVLTDTTNSRAWFVPVFLLTGDKGAGFTMKLRQFALGPQSVGAFAKYYETGPTLVAQSVSASTATQNGAPWLMNVKV